MKITDEMLVAFADGELDPEVHAHVERAIAADPELGRKVEAHRRLRQTLTHHFGPIADEPVPEHLKALLTGQDLAAPATVVSLAGVRARRVEEAEAKRRWRPGWGIAAAMAASLVLGLAVGQNMGGSGPVAISGGTIVAQGELAKALDRQLASAQAMGLPTRIGLSFRSKEGSICRTFAGQAMSGIACEEDGRWRLEQILSGGRKATDYRQASAADPRLAAAVEDMIAGVPFDAEAERAARDADWRQ
ncbi:MAG TPA: anti-sigma factor [Rhizorhapis sp.]